MRKHRKAFIIGASGMLGQAVKTEFLRSDVSIVTVGRAAASDYILDIAHETIVPTEVRRIATPNDLIINCVGWLPQHSSGNENVDKYLSQRLNVDLPAELEALYEKNQVHTLQIGTDCVFSGSNGPYDEDAVPDDKSIYGKTKAQGERANPSALLIRCSIVGPNQHSRANLFEWYKHASEFGDVNGFINHLWNGVTTKSFARLALALFKENCLAPGTRQHWVPANFVSKAELLDIFRTLLGRETRVQSTLADKTVDRRLSTLRAGQNEMLWAMAGYPDVPSIDKLCQEMVRNLDE